MYLIESIIVVAIALLALVDQSYSAVVFKLGQCPNVPGQATLDKAQYLGTWYEYKRFPAIFEAGLDCTTATYGDAGDKISVTNSGTLRLNFFGRRIVLNENSIDGFASIPDPSKPAELSVSFGGVDMGGNSPNYFIQDTDYINYSVVFSCAQFPGFNIQFAWILTRAPGVAPSNLATLESNLSAAGVDVSKFRIIDQTDCPV
ncbi:apolipoprotein d [Plakobranchus ocellatus]|uniref:Apolipoprotein D n=1 Tax=Plakobranchus ocellatus TaxID=259542 RepID=A0AAV4ACE9_9GAST|nr:apolipoprotein d [Plakobranchus ocellatus]